MRTTATPLRGALIGCGYVSQFHLEGWSRVPDARIVALCDMDRERLERASARAPEARCHTEAAKLFDHEDRLDFVEICTQPESHGELTELAARHGVHILCQKPAALERPEFRAMIDACITAGVRLMIHENWRFRPWNRALRAEIDSAVGPARVTLRPAMELDGVRMIASLAFDGYGPAILPATAVPGHLRERFAVVPLDGFPRRRVGIAQRRRGLPSAPVRAVIDILGLVVSDPLAMPEGIHPT